MHKALLALAVLSVSLAGCGDKGEKAPDPVTCPDGTILTSEQIEAFPDHHDAGFNATSHCPVAPSVTFTGLPASLQSFATAMFHWTVDNGSVPEGHSMLTAIRYGDRSVPDRDLTNVAKYPTELIKKEHQSLPVSFMGNLSFAKVGKVYLRAYAQVQGQGYERQEFWSPEVVLEVTPVQPTGLVVDFTHKAGNAAGSIDPPSQDLSLGDGVRLVNEDLVEHTCKANQAPVAVPALHAAASTGTATASDTVVLDVPGTYVYTCDDLVMPKGFSVNVRLP